jgi:3-oxoadipate enol-lactonase
MTTGLLRIASGALAFQLRGRPGAPPLLLLRPLGGSMSLWGAFADRLAIEHHVIAFDPRGIGRSSEPPWSISTRAMAGDARQLLDGLGFETADVFGLSLGGMVASWLAIDAPARVRRLILASTLPRPAALSGRARRRFPALLLRSLRSGRDAAATIMRHVLSPEFRRAQPARVDEIDALMREQPTRRLDLAKLTLAAARHDAADRLREIAAPTLILLGDRDPLVGPQAQQELLRLLPHAHLERIADAGHDLTLEQPLETAERVLAFLR